MHGQPSIKSGVVELILYPELDRSITQTKNVVVTRLNSTILWTFDRCNKHHIY